MYLYSQIHGSVHKKLHIILYYKGTLCTVDVEDIIMQLIKTHCCVSCSQVRLLETLCVIYMLAIFSRLQHKKLLSQFNQNHVLDALQSCYLTYQIWKELAQRFPRYVIPKSSEFLHIFQHSLIQPYPTLNSTKFAPSIMLYNANIIILCYKYILCYIISIKIERVIHNSR